MDDKPENPMSVVVPEWSPATVGDRLYDCLVMLKSWGMLTDAEAAKVKARIEKAIKKEAK